MESLALVPPDPRVRAAELLRRHGRCTVAFQTLEPGFKYWFDRDDAVVAYADTGGAWVAGGGPIAPVHRVAEVARAFVDAAAAQNKRASFFAAEHTLANVMPHIQIGEQPIWKASEWAAIVESNASLRYQISRAKNKGVRVRRAVESDPIDALALQWQASKQMAPMRFLVQLDLSPREERTVYVAEREGTLVGLAATLPVYAADRTFIEDLLRAPNAPNGTNEALVDAVMRDAFAPEVTLGLAPLAGGVSRWLRLAKWLGGPLYDFEGLRAFKAKLKPTSWEPVYLCTEGSRLGAVRDSLRAFAGGSLVVFAGKTLFRRG